MKKLYTVKRIADKKEMISYNNIWECFSYMAENGVWDFEIEVQEVQ